MISKTFVTAVALTASAGTAPASITITQQNAAAPTYATTLNFDEAGGPTGSVATSAWAGIGLSIMDAGDLNPQVDDFATLNGQPWLGTGNSFFGNFGIFMTFDSDLTAWSGQIWDPSGPPSPFGGGLNVFVFDDGVQVATSAGTPAWGGVGDSWWDIVATGGMVFDEIRILGFGFDPTTYGDNFSWNAVPAPSTAAVLGLGCFAARRRRA